MIHTESMSLLNDVTIITDLLSKNVLINRLKTRVRHDHSKTIFVLLRVKVSETNHLKYIFLYHNNSWLSHFDESECTLINTSDNEKGEEGVQELKFKKLKNIKFKKIFHISYPG